MNDHTSYDYPTIHRRLVGYPYRVWIFAILITPILDALVYLILDKNPTPFSIWYFIWYLLTIALLTAFSFPSMVVYIIVFARLASSNLSPLVTKSLLSVTGICIIWLVGYWLKDNSLFHIITINNSNTDLIIFSTVFLILSLFFNLKEQ